MQAGTCERDSAVHSACSLCLCLVLALILSLKPQQSLWQNPFLQGGAGQRVAGISKSCVLQYQQQNQFKPMPAPIWVVVSMQTNEVFEYDLPSGSRHEGSGPLNVLEAVFGTRGVPRTSGPTNRISHWVPRLISGVILHITDHCLVLGPVNLPGYPCPCQHLCLGLVFLFKGPYTYLF